MFDTPTVYLISLYNYTLTQAENARRLEALEARLTSERKPHKFVTFYNQGTSEGAVLVLDRELAATITHDYEANYYTERSADGSAVRHYADGTTFYLGKFARHYGRMMPAECFIDDSGTVWATAHVYKETM